MLPAADDGIGGIPASVAQKRAIGDATGVESEIL
jgi:hypothetical protein